MLFNSLDYIFLFLPTVVGLYYLCAWLGFEKLPQWILLGASLTFYSLGGQSNLLLFGSSILGNYTLGQFLSAKSNKPGVSRAVLIVGIAANLCVLGYYKYSNFMLDNLAAIMPWKFSHLEIVLPLAISFFTFQQITYLVDSYRGIVEEHNLRRYSLFVSFFPQLIAGPIVHHKEMMPQFARLQTRYFHSETFVCGLYIFSIGLAKKVILADQFAVWANFGYENPDALNSLQAWMTTLSYTFQLYFDFSGYTDMAIGAALMLNIDLPDNFRSPYLSTNIQDFWRRWHITLGRFLRDYIYIPAGGNTGGGARLYRNLLLTFLIGGIWHGAGWTFIIWGLMHGVAQVLFRLWQICGRQLPVALSWLLTFLFVHIGWVFFRAPTVNEAAAMLSKLFSFDSGSSVSWAAPDYNSQSVLLYIMKEVQLLHSGNVEHYYLLYSICLVLGGLLICLLPWNSAWLRQQGQLTRDFRAQVFFALLLCWSIFTMHFASSSEFLYFNF